MILRELMDISEGNLVPCPRPNMPSEIQRRATEVLWCLVPRDWLPG